MRKVITAGLTTSVAFAGILAAAPAASAEPNPPGCPKEYFCLYGGPNQTGSVWKTRVNYSGDVMLSGSAFNNGVYFPGADHVQLSWTAGGVGYTRCLHYNPGPGQYKFNFGKWVHVTKVVWRGEC